MSISKKPTARRGNAYSFHNDECNMVISVRGSAGELLPYLVQGLIKAWEQINPELCPRKTLENVHLLAQSAAVQVFQRELTDFSDKSDRKTQHKTSGNAETGLPTNHEE